MKQTVLINSLNLLIFFLLLVSITSHMCGLNLLNKPKRILIHQENESTRNLKEEEWQPIRIQLDFSFIENNVGIFSKEDIRDLKEKIMPKTQEVLQKLFKVKRGKNKKLKLLSPKCDDFVIPDIYQEHGEGVDADIVIFVTMDSTGFFLQNNIEAAATHCLQSSENRRPIAGYIQFKPKLMVNDSTATDYMVWLAIHEITHVLVFNDSLYDDFIDSNMKPLGIDKVVGRKILPSGKKMSFLKSPKILEVGRAHYGCKEFEGVPLEYNGGAGTAGAHWSKKYMNTDYMIGDSYGENLISDITLALFEDSGWYKVDYTQSNLFNWGKDKGCAFFDRDTKCIQQEKNIISTKFKTEFCTKFNYPVCSNNNIFRANCKMRNYKVLMPYERYLEDPTLAGFDSLTDKCPIPIEDKKGQLYYGGSCRVGFTKTINSFEKVCPECACFMANLREKTEILEVKKVSRNSLRFKQINSQNKVIINSNNSTVVNITLNLTMEITQMFLNNTNIDIKNSTEMLRKNNYQTEIELTVLDFKSMCFEYKCESNQLYVLINQKSYKCNGTSETVIPGFDGNVICPPSDVLCNDKFKCKFGCTDKYENSKGYKIY